jgi:iron(III) transport system substrate-binding protein
MNTEEHRWESVIPSACIHLCSPAAILLFFVFFTPRALAADRVVIYTSVDQPIAEPILREFEKQSGIAVQIRTDTEASKSVGLAERLRAEKDNPLCDVWWGNEVFHTIRLADDGVLAAYDSPAGRDIPAQFKDSQGKWYSAGLRARVIAAYTGPTAVLPEAYTLERRMPKAYRELLMSRPTAGTTGGHVAALYVLLGQDRADQVFRDLRDVYNVRLVGGNSVVAREVGQGTVRFGLTDNDDVAAVLGQGGRLSMILPDQHEGGIGTLTMPTTVALVAGARNPEPAKKLIDHLLTPVVEQKLIDAKFAGWSVRGGATGIRSMNIDYREVARAMPEAVRRATDILEGRLLPRTEPEWANEEVMRQSSDPNR